MSTLLRDQLTHAERELAAAQASHEKTVSELCSAEDHIDAQNRQLATLRAENEALRKERDSVLEDRSVVARELIDTQQKRDALAAALESERSNR